MFDIGFSELLIVAVLTLIVMGPERLPETVRTLSLWFDACVSSCRQLGVRLKTKLELMKFVANSITKKLCVI